MSWNTTAKSSRNLKIVHMGSEDSGVYAIYGDLTEEPGVEKW